MKKLLSMLLAVMLLAAFLPAVTAEEPAEEEELYFPMFAEGTVNVYTAQSTASDILWTMEDGSDILVHAVNEFWFKTKTNGFIRVEDLRYTKVKPGTEAPAPETPAEEAPAATPVVEAPAQEVPAAAPVVEAPAQEVPAAEPVAEAPAAEPTEETPAAEPAAEEPIAEEPAAEEPAIEEPTDGEPAAEEEPASQSIILDGDTEINVREGADGMAAIFISIPAGSEVTVVRIDGDWVISILMILRIT